MKGETVRKKMTILCEVCIDSFSGAMTALNSGADRLEVCANLIIGGSTPSAGLFKRLRTATGKPLHVLIRPRGGDFIYRDDEISTMLEDIQIFKELGADGIVCGVLSEDGSLDSSAMKQLCSATAPLSLTFHRAIDICRYPSKVLSQLLSLGVGRILTSGQALNPLTGAGPIREWMETFPDLVFMAGGGITPLNVSDLLGQVPLKEIHFSGTILKTGRYQTEVSIGRNAPEKESARLVTDSHRLDDIFTQVREFERDH